MFPGFKKEGRGKRKRRRDVVAMGLGEKGGRRHVTW
jgi:hypothetical protein